jgi:hypothetical protein
MPAVLPVSRWVAVLAALGCTGCPSAAAPPLIRWEPPTTLGDTMPERLLARGFVARGDEQPGGFGYYIYLVFQPHASKAQRLLAAEAFMTQPERAGYQTLPARVPRQQLALLLAPIRTRTEPTTARELVAGYDASLAAVITAAVATAGIQLPAVSLVAYPRPLTPGIHPGVELLVGDACGASDEVNTRFRQLREGLLVGNVHYDGVVIRWMATLGRFLTRGTTEACL